LQTHAPDDLTLFILEVKKYGRLIRGHTASILCLRVIQWLTEAALTTSSGLVVPEQRGGNDER